MWCKLIWRVVLSKHTNKYIEIFHFQFNFIMAKENDEWGYSNEVETGISSDSGEPRVHVYSDWQHNDDKGLNTSLSHGKIK